MNTIVLVTSAASRPGAPSGGRFRALERGMIAKAVAVGDRPENVALVQIDRDEAPVRRLERIGQPLRPGRAAASVCFTKRQRRLRMLRLAQRDDRGQVRRRHVEDAGLLIERGAAPVGAAVGARHQDRALRSFRAAEQHRRRVERAVLVLADDLQRFGLQLRREVDQIVVGDALLIERRRLGRESAASANTTRRARCPAAPAALRSATPAGRSRDRARRRTPASRPARRALMRRPLTVMSAEDRRGRKVVVPEAVMDRLEVPHALAGLARRGRRGFRRTGCCRAACRRSSRPSASSNGR